MRIVLFVLILFLLFIPYLLWEAARCAGTFVFLRAFVAATSDSDDEDNE